MNGKVYIGQTVMDIEERFKLHLKPSTIKKRSNYKIYNAMSKYGVEKFYIELLEDNIPLENLDRKEIEYIALYDSYKNGYNSTSGGDGRIINSIKDEDELLNLAKSGCTAIELADRFNVHQATILRTLHKLGFYYYRKDNEIINLAERGLSNKDIADVLNIHPETVSRCLARNNKRKHRLPLNKRADFDYNGLFLDYQNQMPINLICDKYDISETTLGKLRKKYKVETRKQIYKSKTMN